MTNKANELLESLNEAATAIKVTNVGDAKSLRASNKIKVVTSKYSGDGDEGTVSVNPSDETSATDLLKGMGMIPGNSSRSSSSTTSSGKEQPFTKDTIGKLKEGDKVYGFFNGAKGDFGKPQWREIAHVVSKWELIFKNSSSSSEIDYEGGDRTYRGTFVISKYSTN
jgi:hypothetical protein